MKKILILIILSACRTPTENVVVKEENGTVNVGELGSEVSDTNPNLNIPYGIVLGPGFGRSAYYVGFLQSIEKCGVKVSVVTGSGFGFLLGKLWALNHSTFEWNFFKVSNVQWWVDSENNFADISNHIDTSLKKLYMSSQKSTPVLEPELVSPGKFQLSFKEVVSTDNLIDNFYFPYFLPKEGVSVYNFAQFDPYPVDKVREMDFKNIVVVTLLNDLPERAQVPDLKPEELVLISSLEKTGRRNIEVADINLKPHLDNYGIKTYLAVKYGELKSMGFNDGTNLWKKEGFACGNQQ